MKNIFTFYILLLLGFFLNAQNLKSPDNNLDLNFSIDEKGRAFYSLNFHDKPVILTLSLIHICAADDRMRGVGGGGGGGG